MLSIYQSLTGIGDAVCGVYAVCGLADKLRKDSYDKNSNQQCLFVRFHTSHFEWLERIKHDGVIIGKFDDFNKDTWFDIGKNYDLHLREAESRKQWYCDQVLLGARPICPSIVDTSVHKYSLEKKPYVVLAPFSHWASRHWPVSHWKYLIAMLHDRGIHSVILDGPGDGSKLRDAFGSLPDDWATWYWGHKPQWVTDIVLGSIAVIGIDTGLIHLSGLLKRKTIVIMSHLPPSMVYSHVDEILHATPYSHCVFCRWQRAKGFRDVCDSGCSALASVLPEDVVNILKNE